MAAGAGYIEFATGDILTTSAANSYLASQVVMVFADASARTSAIASPQEGMISYLKSTDSTEYYSGSTWAAIGGASGGMTLLSTTTLSGTSTSISVSPSGYNELKIYVTGVNCASDYAFTMGVNSDSTASNYRNSWSADIGYALDEGRTSTVVGSLIYTIPGVNGTESSDTNNSAMITIGNPNSTVSKNILTVSAFLNDSAYRTSELVQTNYVTTSAISSLQFISNQSLTAGTVKIYGVK